MSLRFKPNQQFKYHGMMLDHQHELQPRSLEEIRSFPEA
jgi:hypothetical protein